jgi:hypothetical protein
VRAKYEATSMEDSVLTVIRCTVTILLSTIGWGVRERASTPSATWSRSLRRGRVAGPASWITPAREVRSNHAR